MSWRRRRRIARALNRARGVRAKVRREWAWLRRDLRDIAVEIRGPGMIRLPTTPAEPVDLSATIAEMSPRPGQPELSREDVARRGLW